MMRVIGSTVDKYLQILSKLYNEGIEFIIRQEDVDGSAKSMGSVFSTRLTMVTTETVNKLINSDKVVIFSKTTCPYCKMAKECFNKLEQSFTAIELDQKDDGDDYQTILEKITGARTVPRVFVNGECLGGGSDIKKLYESGELAKKLA